MLPRLEMSRDECRKCLRCLELDAYANMVSVLRAQGPFTVDKRKLLQELASVLHISNERHRAEIRRAVNDDKLSSIAEQLNGPNTGTDWAIEGRRTVPLLPRLKAHNAFTTLANSLSIVTAIANERQPRIRAKSKNVKVKVETDDYADLQAVEKSCIILQSDDLDSRKRNRSMLEVSDNESSDHISDVVKKKNNSVKCKSSSENEVLLIPSSSPVDTFRYGQTINKTLKNITCLPSSPNASQNKSVTVIPIGASSTGPNLAASVKNLIPQTIVYNNAKIQKICRTVNSSVPITLPSIVKTKPKLMTLRTSPNIKDTTASVSYNIAQNLRDNGVEKAVNINNDKGHTFISLRSNIQKITKSDMNSNTQCVKTITHPTMQTSTTEKCFPISETQTTTTSQCVTSSGPGPPNDAKITTSALIHKSFPSVKLNKLPTAKMSAARLTTKGNVIVLQKGPLREITLSHGGKEVLGKVIMGGKNVCLANPQNANSITFLPHRIPPCNGDQTIKIVTTTNTTALESNKSNVKANNNVLLDIHQDGTESNKVDTKFSETPDIFDIEFQTALVNQNNNFTVQERNNESTNSCIEHLVQDSESLETQEHGSQDICEDTLLNKSGSYEIMESEEKSKIIFNEDEEGQTTVMEGILDPQTGIYNFHTTDESMNNIQIEELSNSGLGIFSSALTPSDINLETYSYMETDETSNIFDATENSMLIIDEIDELRDS